MHVATIYNLTKALLKKECGLANIKDLRTTITYHEKKYYVDDKPIISDYEYDQLFAKLVALEKQYPDSITPDSPTQRVSNDLHEDASTISHLVPMLSLANSYNYEDLQAFDNQIKKLCDLDPDEEIEYIVEPKYDGGSIALVYENDLLVRSATRGNGQQGEEMTPNARAIPSIPLGAAFSDYNIQKAEIRGEALIRKDRFETINKQRLKEGSAVFANPRNAATGGLRMKDPRETRARELEFFAFQLSYGTDTEGNDMLSQIHNHSENIQLLKNIGFKVPNVEKLVVKGIHAVSQICQEWEEQREQYPYEIDGMVVKVNNLRLQEICGSTQHHPRWAIAFKFQAKQATTTLLDVEYQVGKVGSITPVAKLQPVSLAGVTVSSVSLHNEEFIETRDLHLGDQVLVERAGDVIPYIVKALDDVRSGNEIKISFPRECPVCGTALVKEKDEAAWRCPNFHCQGRTLQRLIFHVSKDAMDIDGFGKSYVERFHQEGWLTDISDVYNLDYDSIEKLSGFGTRSVEKLRQAIEEAKRRPISRLLHSLSIHHLGKKASKIIAAHIDSIWELKEWDHERYMDIKDIGPVVARNVYDYFKDERNISMLERMETFDVNTRATEADKPVVVKEDAVFSGKTILFTGSLQNLSRKEAQKIAESLGAKNISAVSRNLDILVVGEKAGSKLKKAQELGSVHIITEEEFIKLTDV